MTESSWLPLGSIEGQEHAIAALGAMLETHATPPPLLFHGPEGCGKRTTALAFAAALVCSARQGLNACGVCSGCQRVRSAIAVSELRGKSSSQDRAITYPDVGLVSVPPRKTRISILQARDICQSMMSRPFEFERRIYIIEPADLLTPAAANSLLKIVEEPPSYGVLILVTAAPWSLPITLRSRLRRVSFRRLREAVVVRHLRAMGLSEDEARCRAHFSRGSLSLAADLDPQARAQAIGTWMEILERLSQGEKPGALAVAASEVFAGDVSAARSSLELLLTILRDLAASAVATDPLLLEPGDSERLSGVAEMLIGSSGQRAALVDRLAGELVRFNRNPRLAVEGAVLALSGVLRNGDLPA